MSNPTQNSVDFPSNPNDKKPLPEIIAELAMFTLAYMDWEDGNRYYSIQDWIVGVAQTDNPRDFWYALKKRIAQLSMPYRQFPYRAKNGRTYQMDYGSADVLYQIAQRMDAETGIRDKVLRFLAKAGW